MICKEIKKLVNYGIVTGLIEESDRIYATNRLLNALKIQSYTDEAVEETRVEDLEAILGNILDYAVKQGICQDSPVYRDLFDTELMGILTPRPSQVINTFNDLYKEDPKAATDYFYKLSCDSDYIRRYRIARDVKWVYPDPVYGDIDISINLSKPEKDPKAIAAAAKMAASSYPKCNLCPENEGYAGSVSSPARQNHRIIPVTVNESAWCLQYSPYVYYNEHCIVFNKEHVPMKIEKATFKKLLDFVERFPHYFVGSNADLPIVGGSILSHDHFQGGNYTFAMAKAPIETEISFNGFEDVKAGIVKWPMSVIRLASKQPKRLVDLSSRILDTFRGYTDESAFILAYTDNTSHNTITPIARYNEDTELYEIDLVLRNNITTDEHPLGVYHPHAELHNIKKENIGLIEVMGLAILPARLKAEMQALAMHIINNEDISKDELTAKHKTWVDGFIDGYTDINADNVDDILKYEIGKVFSKVLENAGIFKRDEAGKAAFLRFVDAVNKA